MRTLQDTYYWKAHHQDIIEWLRRRKVNVWRIEEKHNMLLMQIHPAWCRTIGLKSDGNRMVAFVFGRPLPEVDRDTKHCDKYKLAAVESEFLQLMIREEGVSYNAVHKYGVMLYVPPIPDWPRVTFADKRRFAKWLKDNIRTLLYDVFLRGDLKRFRELQTLWHKTSGCGAGSWENNCTRAEEDLVQFNPKPISMADYVAAEMEDDDG